MKKYIVKSLIVGSVMAVTMSISSCEKTKILTPNYLVTSSTVYSTPMGYKQALAKVYGAFALTGNQGPAGNADIAGIDEGSSDFFRLFWEAQELPTDEAVIAWGDPGLPDFHSMSWSSANLFLLGVYDRSLYQITLCNEFIRQSSDDNLSSRGITGTDATNIRYYRAEARFLRAYQYWVLMDLFGNPPFATETTPIATTTPPQISRTALFAYIESELKAIDGLLVAPKQNEYGRADNAAVWALLARIYLNAGIYTGTTRYTDALTYANKVIASGYSLTPKYDNLMLADNNLNTNEFILTINYDGNNTQNYGGTTFMTHAPVGGSEPSTSFGISGGWAGLRTTSAFVSLFPANPTTSFPNNGNPDTRAELWTSGQSLAITDITSFTQGYAVTKFRNVTSAGAAGSSLSFSDVDMPIFRLPEMYLIYAESVLRGGAGGDAATALTYVNDLRTRAYGNTNGNIASTGLTLSFVLDERGRELYWEGFRRTDLIRYGEFVESTYLWPFKGGVASGTSVASYRVLYPIPANDLSVNTNLKQNTGY